MKSTNVICGLVFFYLFVPIFCFAGKTVPIVPVNGKAVIVVVNGNEKNYYLISKANSAKISVEGPAKVEILTRLGMKSDNSSAEKYSVKILENNEIVKIYSTTTSKSDASFRNLNYFPAKSRKFSIDVPEGTHNYELFLDAKDDLIAALKFGINSKLSKRKNTNVDLQPLIYDKVVTAVIKEKLITYYTSSKQKNVQLRIVGPTKLQITGRLNFDAAMKGMQKYNISVWENNKKLLVKPLSTTKSLGIVYEEMKDVVPGKPDKIIINVPTGEHIYKFDLEETPAHSVSLKFSIPKKDLGNEE